MAKTGLLVKLATKLADDWRAYQQKETTFEALAFQDGLKDTLKMYKELAEAQDPEAILKAEQIAIWGGIAAFHLNTQNTINKLS
ncbi:hypothetical protein [Maridesulfovibrio sp. FT414]|uniref:hypothetical protein n=1 Tax=Maridesulfovibrio sp. FT414 TaxID=2979469 RepID=UPI003D801B43